MVDRVLARVVLYSGRDYPVKQIQHQTETKDCDLVTALIQFVQGGIKGPLAT